MARRKKLLVADLLCGAGGSSTGCMRAFRELGLQMELVCVNHWGVAIETHKINHPEARHYVQDIAAVRPHLIVPEGRLDLLMASPTCTHHSVARGGKPTSDQQRSDPWHINTWLTELDVERLIIENVWEFIGWGPVDPKTGKPIKARKGEYFQTWIESLRRLGYNLEWRKLNAADFGDATTRQRFIMMGRKDRRPIRWPTPTHAKRDANQVALFPGMKPWKPARDIIDWDIKGKSIYGRKKALAPKTLARIEAGIVKFGWPEPFIVTLRNHMGAQSVDAPIPTVAANGTHIGLAQPFVLATGSTGAPRTTDDPLPTITTGGAGSEDQGCARPMLVEAFIVSVAHGAEACERLPHDRRVKSIDEPIGAVHAGGGNFAIAEPFVLSRQGGGAPRSVDDPTPAQVAKHSHVLITPYYSKGSNKTYISTEDDPLPTITSKRHFNVVFPVTHSDTSQRARDVETDPLPTVTTAKRGELAFITAQHGERPGQAPRVHDIEQPAPTIAASGHVDLIEGTPEFDILFRMLEPHELAAAMGFNDEEQAYEFTGTKTEQVKQIGNAVSVAKMKACVGAMMADAVPKKRAQPVKPAKRAAA